VGALTGQGRAIRVAGTVLLFAVLATLVFSLAGFFFPEERVISPRIDPVVSGQAPLIVTTTYPFQDRTATVSVTVNGSVYEAAKRADKSVTVIGNISENTWIPESYRAMINDPAQEPLYTDLLTVFREIRVDENLDNDEYLELIAVYVQSLGYETLEETPAKFPVETVVDQAGDCDDKSLLLAGLLSREDYSVALLSFGPEKHMAVGIESEECPYGNTGYLFLETTNITYIGVVSGSLDNGRPIESEPVVIPVGNGTKTYTRCAETRYIEDIRVQSRTKAEEMEGVIQKMETALTAERQEILAMENRLQGLKTTGNIREYNTLVTTHNAKVSAYNTALQDYHDLFARYETNVNIYNFIISHEFDRKGVFNFIKTTMPS
jgi:hypothetical protein